MMEQLIETSLGRLSVRSNGDGPVVVVWHSLFVDARSMEAAVGQLADTRRVVQIEGPGHGASEATRRLFDLDDCADAAVEVLETLGIDEPVDWVGNAWGGHVGLVFAVRHADRCRSVVTFGAPVQALTSAERRRTILLVAAYLVLGPASFIRSGVADVLLSERSRRENPAAVDLVSDCLRNAGRRSLANVIRSISLRRSDLDALLPQVTAPTLMVTGAEHSGWTPAQVDAAVSRLPVGRSAVVADAAYLIPLERPERATALILDLWAEVAR